MRSATRSTGRLKAALAEFKYRRVGVGFRVEGFGLWVSGYGLGCKV